jgi:hypothetical protein
LLFGILRTASANRILDEWQINTNPVTDWGSATVTITNAIIVSEPATMGLIGLFGGGMMFVRRFVS